MNDYVSYTVIATGFDSGRKTFITPANKSELKKTGEQLSFRGGFNFMDNDSVDKQDLEVPTIIRVQSPDTQLENAEEDELAESSFTAEASRYSWAKQRMEKKEPEKKSDNDDDESSSFLRMIMD